MKNPEGRRWKRLLLFLLIVLPLLTALTGAGIYLYFGRDLPDFRAVTEYSPETVTRVYARGGELIDEFYVERRILVPLSRIPPHVVKAFLAAEDARFFEHKGVDFISILRAIITDIRAGRIVQGGSTITQQVVKTLFLTPERTLSRKIKEAILAFRIERNLTKDEILYLYLNQIYLGHGAYGVQAAAETYFGKDVSELSLAEAALLAGLPKAPNRYSPYNNPEGARKRLRYVIERMVEEGFISKEEARQALSERIKIRPKKAKTLGIAPYFSEYVRRYIEEKYGYDALYRGGLKVYTTLDVDLQDYARKAISRGLRNYDKRHGYRGPLKHLKEGEIKEFLEESRKALAGAEPAKGTIYKGVVLGKDGKGKYYVVQVGPYRGKLPYRDMEWATLDGKGKRRNVAEVLKRGDVVEVRVERAGDEGVLFSLEQEPEAQAALVAIDPLSGEVRAMVGGYDFRKSQFNRAIQARRQPGSAFKPIIYAAAMDKGYTPASIFVDSPVIYETSTGDGERVLWKPENFGKEFYGPITLREALAKSRNLVTIKLLNAIGVDYVIGYARKLGIRSSLNRDLSLALGSSGLSLLELTSAYSVFAARGIRYKPIFIRRIVDKDGRVLEENLPEGKEVISPETAYIMTSLLEGVIKKGTGWRARALGRPAAGKTGTTDEYRDAWFIGYTPDIVAGVWVGFDDYHTLGELETGSRAALPIWLYFMKAAHRGRPVKDFPVPEGVVFRKIDPKTGRPVPPWDKRGVFEVFKKGTEPRQIEPVISNSGRFFEFDGGGQVPVEPEDEKQEVLQ